LKASSAAEHDSVSLVARQLSSWTASAPQRGCCCTEQRAGPACETEATANVRGSIRQRAAPHTPPHTGADDAADGAMLHQREAWVSQG
jgi:hypothetical protein